MRPEDLRTFLRVAEVGGLRRAADSLSTTQSALSKTLARLERAAGLPLVMRTPQGVVLTEAGWLLHDHAQRILTAQDDLDQALSDQRLARAGQVRIGCVPSLISGLLSPLLAGFFSSRPLATFILEPHLTAGLLALLQAGRIDLAVGAVPDVLPDGLSMQRVAPLLVQVVSRSDHPRRRHFHDVRRLLEERWALPASGQHLRHWLERSFQQAGLPAPMIAIESSASPAALVELLRCSDLVGLVPASTLSLPAGQGLAAVPCPGMAWEYDIAVFWRTGAYLSPMGQDFRAALLATVATTTA